MCILVEGELSRARLALNGLLLRRLFILEFGKGLAEIILLDLFGSVCNGIVVSTIGTAECLGSGHKLLNRPALFTGELGLCNGLFD